MGHRIRISETITKNYWVWTKSKHMKWFTVRIEYVKINAMCFCIVNKMNATLCCSHHYLTMHSLTYKCSPGLQPIINQLIHQSVNRKKCSAFLWIIWNCTLTSIIYEPTPHESDLKKLISTGTGMFFHVYNQKIPKPTQFCFPHLNRNGNWMSQ